MINMTHKLDLVSDTSFLNFMGDDFLRLLMCRHIFASCVLRAHRSFRGRGATFQVWSLTQFLLCCLLDKGLSCPLPRKGQPKMRKSFKIIWSEDELRLLSEIIASLWCFISRGEKARQTQLTFELYWKLLFMSGRKAKEYSKKTYLQKLLSKIRFKFNVNSILILTLVYRS